MIYTKNSQSNINEIDLLNHWPAQLRGRAQKFYFEIGLWSFPIKFILKNVCEGEKHERKEEKKEEKRGRWGGGERGEEGKRGRKRMGQVQVWMCVCSISHSIAFQQEDWKSSEQKDLFFKHVLLWRKGHDMPKCWKKAAPELWLGGLWNSKNTPDCENYHLHLQCFTS